ncbi:TolC family protein [Siculibacillus lacustris]|uniref:TolC family protein n=1 Tax=Siculibacillus lacustris TaxID=1549641 RepID=UPI0019D0E9A4|nr:TolC family protein [Siculibacillus lacustris]
MATALASCAVAPTTFTDAEFQAKATADMTAMFAADEPVSQHLTLAGAIARALKYNLDNRAKMIEQALAANQTEVDGWDLLPKAAASGGYVGRSDHATTTSRDSVTGQPSLANPSYSLDRDRGTADLGLAWNLLDFGVSYFNAHQDADRVLVAAEHRRKAVQKLVQDVRTAFWKAAAAQALDGTVRRTIAEAEGALRDSRAVESGNFKSPIDALRFQRSLLENIRQLELVSQQLATAREELCVLINVRPGTPLRLDAAGERGLPSIPYSLPQMEEIAFVGNPDLREQAYVARITADETRKSILKLLPNVSLTASREFDSNSFLIKQQWYDAGARVSLNLISLLSIPDRMKLGAANEALADARRLAVRMAVLSQVHIAYLDYGNSRRAYRRASQIADVEGRLTSLVRARSDGDALGVLERISSETSAIGARLRRQVAYADAQQALARVYATLGIDLLPEGTTSDDLDALTATVAQSLTAWDRGRFPSTAIEPVKPAPLPTVTASVEK